MVDQNLTPYELASKIKENPLAYGLVNLRGHVYTVCPPIYTTINSKLNQLRRALAEHAKKGDNECDLQYVASNIDELVLFLEME
jgi:hypothetical protein